MAFIHLCSRFALGGYRAASGFPFLSPSPAAPLIAAGIEVCCAADNVPPPSEQPVSRRVEF